MKISSRNRESSRSLSRSDPSSRSHRNSHSQHGPDNTGRTREPLRSHDRMRTRPPPLVKNHYQQQSHEHAQHTTHYGQIRPNQPKPPTLPQSVDLDLDLPSLKAWNYVLMIMAVPPPLAGGSGWRPTPRPAVSEAGWLRCRAPARPTGTTTTGPPAMTDRTHPRSASIPLLRRFQPGQSPIKADQHVSSPAPGVRHRATISPARRPESPQARTPGDDLCKSGEIRAANKQIRDTRRSSAPGSGTDRRCPTLTTARH